MAMKVDPELTRQLDAARDTDTSVEAVLRLLPAKGKATAASGDAKRRADDAIDRVTKHTGVEPDAVNVLVNLGVVVVAAEEPFVRELLDQPEFESAIANEASTT